MPLPPHRTEQRGRQSSHIHAATSTTNEILHDRRRIPPIATIPLVDILRPARRAPNYPHGVGALPTKTTESPATGRRYGDPDCPGNSYLTNERPAG